MTSPIETILVVAGIGGRLTPAGDKLRMSLPPDAAAELKANIRAHKPALLEVVKDEGRTWHLIQSDALGGVLLFFANDEATKAKLVRHGAHPESVYTRDELAEMVRAGIEPGHLLMVHSVRGVFGARVTAVTANERLP